MIAVPVGSQNEGLFACEANFYSAKAPGKRRSGIAFCPFWPPRRRSSMPGTYNVFLVNMKSDLSKAVAVPTREEQQAILFAIQNAFIPIAQRARPPFDLVNVQWITCPITQVIQPHDLLVYFVPDKIDTLVLKISDAIGDRDLGGATVFLSKTGEHASEVYTSTGNTDLVARLAMHELMHNKLKLGNTMHTERIGGGGIANANISVNDNLTVANINLMASHLRDPHPQWTGGCITSFDPLRGL
jgi:hypothetical protein